MPDHSPSAMTPRKCAAAVFGFLLLLEALAWPIPLPAQARAGAPQPVRDERAT